MRHYGGISSRAATPVSAGSLSAEASAPHRRLVRDDAVIIEFPAARARPPQSDARISRQRELEALYRAQNSKLVRFLTRRLGNEADAQEAAQEAYVRLLQLDEAERPASLQAYLFRIAANVAIDRLRRRRRGDVLEAEFVSEDRIEPTQQAALVAGEQLKALGEALEVLPEACRRAFVLNRHHGWSTLRIAAHLGATDRTVRRYLVRAMQQLTAALDSGAGEICPCG